MKNLDVTKKEAEKIILDFQDLVMKVVAFRGLDHYSVPDMLKNMKALKEDLRHCIENALSAGKQMADAPVESSTSDYVTLDLKSDKKYKM